MTDPFRDTDTSALARVEELERENERLEEELVVAREKGEELQARGPEALRLEQEVIALRKEVESLKATPASATDPLDDQPEPSPSRVVVLGVIAFALVLAALLLATR